MHQGTRPVLCLLVDLMNETAPFISVLLLSPFMNNQCRLQQVKLGVRHILALKHNQASPCDDLGKLSRRRWQRWHDLHRNEDSSHSSRNCGSRNHLTHISSLQHEMERRCHVLHVRPYDDRHHGRGGPCDRAHPSWDDDHRIRIAGIPWDR